MTANKILAYTLILFFFTAPVWAQTIDLGDAIFEDNFNISFGVEITSSSPSVGTGWTKVEDSEGTGTFTWHGVSAGPNGIRSGGTDGSSVCSQRVVYTEAPAPTSANSQTCFSIKARCATTSCNNKAIGVLARYQDTNNYYYLLVYGAESGTSHVVHVGKKVSGSSSSLANTTMTVNNDDGLCLEIIDDDIKVYHGAGGLGGFGGFTLVSALSVTDSDISSAGNSGFWAGNVLTGTDCIRPLWQVWDVGVYELAAGASPRRIWIIQ